MSDYTLIENLSIEPLTLPQPLLGVLRGGGQGVVADTPANVSAMFAIPSNDVGVIVNLKAVPSSTPATIYALPSPLTEVTLAGVQTLTNKTITAPAINGVVTTTGLTLPAFTMGGAIAGGANDIDNVGIANAQVVRGAVSDLAIRPAALGGEVRIQLADGATARIHSNATGLGFFAAAPVAQPVTQAAVGAQDVGAAPDQTSINAAINAVQASSDAMLAKLKTLGLIAT